MRIEEYLNKRIEDLEEGPCNSSVVQGKILAYREILSKLPEMEHEFTMKEFVSFCEKYTPHCEKCGLFDSGECPYQNNLAPCEWDIEEIESKVREA